MDAGSGVHTRAPPHRCRRRISMADHLLWAVSLTPQWDLVKGRCAGSAHSLESMTEKAMSYCRFLNRFFMLSLEPKRPELKYLPLSSCGA